MAHTGEGRHQAPGGWRRAVAGALVGAGLGAWLRLLLGASSPPDRAGSR